MTKWNHLIEAKSYHPTDETLGRIWFLLLRLIGFDRPENEEQAAQQLLLAVEEGGVIAAAGDDGYYIGLEQKNVHRLQDLARGLSKIRYSISGEIDKSSLKVNRQRHAFGAPQESNAIFYALARTTYHLYKVTPTSAMFKGR